jgi:beta-phosphoglucomutase
MYILYDNAIFDKSLIEYNTKIGSTIFEINEGPNGIFNTQIATNLKDNYSDYDLLFICDSRLDADNINELDQNDILPGVLDFLTLLESHHCAMGVGSSSKNAPFILEKLGLASRFAAVIDGNGVKNTKPDPEVFLNAAHQLHVLPENCLVVEDAPSGIQAAKAAGMKVVGVGHDLAEADLCVSSLVGLGWDQIQNL